MLLRLWVLLLPLVESAERRDNNENKYRFARI